MQQVAYVLTANRKSKSQKGLSTIDFFYAGLGRHCPLRPPPSTSQGVRHGGKDRGQTARACARTGEGKEDSYFLRIAKNWLAKIQSLQV
jgi:hypothetical protein